VAKQTGLGDKLYMNGNDLSGDIATITRVETMVNLLQSTSIEDSSETRLQGISDGALAFQSYFNDDGAASRAAAAGSTHVELSTLPTTDVLLYYARGATLDNVMAALTAKQVGYGGARGADGALLFSVETQAAGNPVEFGEQVTAGLVTHASATSSTGKVDAAQTTNGGVGFLQGVEVDSGTATVVIEDSADTTDGTDGTWGTLLTFANTSATWPIGERKTVTGTVEKGLRVTTTGTFTGADFAVGFRRGASGDRVDLS